MVSTVGTENIVGVATAIKLGAFIELEIVWMIADIVNGLMALPNLIAILVLSPIIISETKTYLAHQKNRE